MSKPVIHFAHANGFPSLSYGELIQQLGGSYDFIYKNILAHDERFPVNEGWKNSADEIIDFIERTADKPVIGLGHSFGGTISLIAASKRPDLFESLVLMDPVILVGFIPSKIGGLLKRYDKIGKVTPADKTQTRKRFWRTRDEAKVYFQSKPLFKNFSDRALDLYVEHGLVQNENGVELAFDVPTEVKIYKCVPLDLDQLAPVTIPGVILKGKTSDVSRKPFVNRVAKVHGLKVHTIEGGHMFPFENAKAIADHLNG